MDFIAPSLWLYQLIEHPYPDPNPTYHICGFWRFWFLFLKIWKALHLWETSVAEQGTFHTSQQQKNTDILRPDIKKQNCITTKFVKRLKNQVEREFRLMTPVYHSYLCINLRYAALNCTESLIKVLKRRWKGLKTVAKTAPKEAISNLLLRPHVTNCHKIVQVRKRKVLLCKSLLFLD